MANVLKPQRLQKGDLIGVISPASAPSSTEKIEKGVRYLESLGYRTRVGKHAATVHGYLAGTDEERAADLNEMLNDRSVRAIIAVRGGYGTPRLLRLVDYRAAKRDPKIIVGYSDLTALQLALFRKTGLVTFSGPMVGVEMWEKIDPFTEEQFWRIMTSLAKIGTLTNPLEEPATALRPGRATGRLFRVRHAVASRPPHGLLSTVLDKLSRLDDCHASSNLGFQPDRGGFGPCGNSSAQR